MAIYHLSIKIISRGKGRSAVAAAAYRAGARITNDYDGITHDYTRKDGILNTEILLPDHAPAEYADRATLWNAVEQAERNKNAQLAREIVIALPVELSAEQNHTLVRNYCQQHFVNAGMCADICIHNKGDGNPHAHVMLTMRPFEQGGSWAAKSRKEYILDEHGERIVLKSGAFKTRKVDVTDWNDRGKAEQWRRGWTDMVNAALTNQGLTERVDHRSYERQGIEQIPTVHLGSEAFRMEKCGIQSERGDVNRHVELDNKKLRQLRTRIQKLQDWLDKGESFEDQSLVDALSSVLDNPQEISRYRKIANLKAVAKAVGFLQTNGITEMEELREKIADSYRRTDTLRDKLKKVERRMKTLDDHIHYAEDYFKHRETYNMYMQQKPRKQDAYLEQHRAEIILYEAAAKYLRPVMNGRTSIPLKSWKNEASHLAAQRADLYHEYSQLKNEVQEMETIRKSVEQAIRNEEKIKRVPLHEEER